MEVTDLSWCERHSEYLREHGTSPEEVTEALIHSIAARGAMMRGYMTPDDKRLAVEVLCKVANGKPICCHLGDEKLKSAIDRAAVSRIDGE